MYYQDELLKTFISSYLIILGFFYHGMRKTTQNSFPYFLLEKNILP